MAVISKASKKEIRATDRKLLKKKFPLTFLISTNLTALKI